jgi:hypothetical protein
VARAASVLARGASLVPRAAHTRRTSSGRRRRRDWDTKTRRKVIIRLAILIPPLFLLLGAGSWGQAPAPADLSSTAMASPGAAPRGPTVVPLRPPGMTTEQPPMDARSPYPSWFGVRPGCRPHGGILILALVLKALLVLSAIFALTAGHFSAPA